MAYWRIILKNVENGVKYWNKTIFGVTIIIRNFISPRMGNRNKVLNGDCLIVGNRRGFTINQSKHSLEDGRFFRIKKNAK